MAGSDQPWLHGLTTVLSAPTVALSDPDGQIRPQGARGVLHADIRVLSQAVLEVNGIGPTPISGGLLALSWGAGSIRARLSAPAATATAGSAEATVRWSVRLPGRGQLRIGWQLAAGTLRVLAGYQGRRDDPVTGEAPGKIPHELRASARPDRPPVYYGTIDATPLWVCLLHDAWRWGMPADQVRELLPALVAALDWMRDDGDADGDGFLEYLGHTGRGLANQGWKDSWDAIRFADGTIASAPVALCEVQGYAYEAAMGGADMLAAFGQPGAAQWRAWAVRLAGAFRERFWISDPAGPYPALALDASKRAVDSPTSNIGHLLGTGLLTADEESLIAARLAGPDLDSGIGLRTMSAANGGYSPLSYHCGSVWSHDTAIAIRGLARAGHHAVAARLADGLLAAAAAFDWRLPELFSGEPRGEVPWPSPYPAACRPQAWAAAAAGALVGALLGLEPDAPAGRLRLDPMPLDPASLDPGPGRRIRIDGLVLGGHALSAGIDEYGQGYLRAPDLSAAAKGPARDGAAGVRLRRRRDQGGPRYRGR